MFTFAYSCDDEDLWLLGRLAYLWLVLLILVNCIYKYYNHTFDHIWFSASTSALDASVLSSARAADGYHIAFGTKIRGTAQKKEKREVTFIFSIRILGGTTNGYILYALVLIKYISLFMKEHKFATNCKLSIKKLLVILIDHHLFSISQPG